MESGVASRYARALFNAALKDKIVHSVNDDLDTIAHIVTHDERFKQFLGNPDSTRSVKIGLFERVFADRVTALTMSMLRLVVEKQREFDLPSIREHYSELRRQHDSVLAIKVISARELTTDQQTAIVAKFEKAKSKKVEATFHVDAAVMGGVKVEFEGNVVDGTVAGNLDKLRERFLRDVLKQG